MDDATQSIAVDFSTNEPNCYLNHATIAITACTGVTGQTDCVGLGWESTLFKLIPTGTSPDSLAVVAKGTNLVLEV